MAIGNPVLNQLPASFRQEETTALRGIPGKSMSAQIGKSTTRQCGQTCVPGQRPLVCTPAPVVSLSRAGVHVQTLANTRVAIDFTVPVDVPPLLVPWPSQVNPPVNELPQDWPSAEDWQNVSENAGLVPAVRGGVPLAAIYGSNAASRGFNWRDGRRSEGNPANKSCDYVRPLPTSGRSHSPVDG